MVDLQSFLDKVATLTPPAASVKLPSSGKEVNITPLNIIQQKKLLTEGVTDEYELIGFTKTLNEIITEEVSDARLCDRAYLAIKLRNISIDNYFGDVDLSELTSDSKWTNGVELIKDIKTGNLSISIEMPYLKDEIALLDYLKANLTRDEEYNTRLIYSVEVLKYIKSLTIDDTVLVLSDLTIADRLELFDKLPIMCTKGVVSYIEEFKENELSLLTVDERVLVIDREFFSV